MNCVGFIVNPIAGMGGRVGLKGTDAVVDEAIKLGARPTARRKAIETLRTLNTLLVHEPTDTRWLSCGRPMGADCLDAAGFHDYRLVYTINRDSGAQDTKNATQRFLDHGVDIILFCGGDGTARDICSIARQRVPLLGIPAGVKMYSGVFGSNPTRTAEILNSFLRGELSTGNAEIIDLDEEKYRQGQWAVRLYDVARVPLDPTYVQATKSLIRGGSDAQIKQEIAGTLCEMIALEPETLFVLGPGSTVKVVAEQLGIEKTLLGIDAVSGGKLVGRDLNESQLLALLARYREHKLLLSPIGVQGFVLGRGNLQVSPAVMREIGAHNLVLVATPEKLSRTPVLRFDTGDADLDAKFAEKEYLPVVTGYRRRRLVKIVI